MILALLSLAAAPLPAAVENEIVVIGFRLKNDWRGTLFKQDGRLGCKTTQSTGNQAIDAIGCGAIVTCTAPIEAQMDQLASAKLSKRERSRRMSELTRSTLPCLENYRAEHVRRLATASAAK